jgi:cysteinyl-tRNA synthetase
MKYGKSSLIQLALVLSLSVGFAVSCKKTNPPLLDYKRDLKFLVENLSDYARVYNKRFILIPNNALPLISKDGTVTGGPDLDYAASITGIHVDGYNFLATKPDDPVSEATKNDIDAWLKIYKNLSNPVFITDYATEHTKILDAYTGNKLKGYTSYVSTAQNADAMATYPDTVSGSNNDSIFSGLLCKNYLYMPKMGNFASKSDFIAAVRSKNYDMLIIDLFFNNTSVWTKSELDSLKIKPGGNRRLVISYLSVGQAQDSRYYWEKRFADFPPLWLADADKNNKGFYNIVYWDREWQNLLYGNDDSYVRKILKAGFDGAFLDRMQPAYEYWEKK